MAAVSVTELKKRIASRIDQTIERESVIGLRQATWTRALALAAIGGWISFRVPFPAAAYYLLVLVLFVAIGLAHQLVVQRDPARPWPGFAFITMDVCLLTFALIYPNPLQADPWPPQMALRVGNFPYFYIFLAGTLLTYSPRQVVWAGIAIAAAWGGAALWIIGLPETATFANHPDWYRLPSGARLDAFLQPTFVDIGGVVRDIFLVLVVTGVLASVVWRMRRLAFQQADAERERANLARYFSPNLVDELTRDHDSLDAEHEREAAVMFLDIRGFTAFAEQLPPQIVLELLRSFHRRMSQQVFAHNGTLDKYIGDGLMATFGVPKKGPRDACNAVACALAMQESVEAWNVKRAERGWQPIEIAVGIHYGPVVTGDIGSEERLEFAVIGDTVNVASRIESLTRDLDTPIALSDDVVAAAHAQMGQNDPLLDGFREAPEQELRGRLTGMIVWTYSETVAEEDRERRLMAIDLAPSAE
ncbi:MAG: adenylate/guanylate cyclase domain-containing protein [Alphaproteobacteria bacterium]|nr:adenylate/guanylate cyclase domain-containing protein [Alphaproteobacteria bacterium]